MLIADEDVVAMAMAIMDTVFLSTGDYDEHYYCELCESRLDGREHWDNFKHEITCPVLIAQTVIRRFNDKL